MASNDFNILLVGLLDKSNVAISDLNEQIRVIQEKLKPLVLKLEIDDNGVINKLITQIQQIQQVSNNVNNSSKDMSKQISQSMQQVGNAAGDAENKIAGLEKAIKNVRRYTVDEQGSRTLKSMSNTYEHSPGVQTRYDMNGQNQMVGSTITDKTGEIEKKKNENDAINSRKEYYRNLKLHDKDIQRLMIDRMREERQYNKELFQHTQEAQESLREREVELKKHHETILNDEREFNRQYNKALMAHNTDVNTIQRQEVEAEQKLANDIRRSRDKETKRIKGLGEKKADVGFSDTDSRFDQLVKAEGSIRNLYGSKVDLKNLEFDPSQNVYKYIAAIKTGKDKFLEYKGSIDVTTKAIYEHGIQTKNTLSRNLGFFDKLKVALSQVPTWMAAMTVFYGSLRSFQQGLRDISAIDASIVDLKKVTEETTETYKKFAIEANSVGTAVGKTTAEVIKSTAEFARLGYTLDQAKVLSKEALIFSTVGDMDVQSASQSLIAAIKGFSVTVDAEGKNIRKVVDVYNEVGNHFAISSYGIAEAVKRSASSMKEAGNTLEQTVALVTAANGVVQDPEQVGTALKTVAMRLRGVSEEGTKVKDLVPTLEASFRSIGLTVMDANGNFKSTFDIMKELSKVWGNLSDIQKADILEKVAGKRQGNIVAALLQNWTDAEAALKSALNSTGSAAKEHAAAMDSIEAKLNTFKNTVTGLWQGTISSDGLKTFIDAGSSVIGILKSLTDNFGLVSVAVGVLSTGFLAFNVGPSQGFIKNIIRKTYETNGLSNALGIATGRLLGASVAEQAMGTATVSTSIKVGLLTRAITVLNFSLNALAGVAFAALGYAISWAVGKWQEHNQKIEEARKALEETTTSYKQNSQTIRDLVKEYAVLSGLSKESALGIKEQERLVEVQDQLGKLLPDVVEKFDAQGHAILKSADAVKVYSDRINELVAIQSKETKNKFELGIADREKKLAEINKQIADAEAEKARGFKNQTFVGEGGFGTVDVHFDKTTQEHLEDEKKLILLQKQKAELVQNWAQDYQDYVKANLEGANVIGLLTKADLEYLKTQAQKEAQQKADNKTNESHLDIVNKMSKQYKGLADARKLMKDPITHAIIGEDPATGNAIIDTAARRIDNLRATLRNAGVDYQQTGTIVASYVAELEKANEVTSASDEITRSWAKTSTDFISAQKELAQTLDKINDGEKLSIDTVMGLIRQYPELIGALEAEGEGLKLNGDKVKDLAKVKEAAFKADMFRKEREMEADRDQLETKISNALAEIGLIKSVSDVRSGALQQYIEEQNAIAFEHDEESRLNAKSAMDKYNALNETYKTAIKALNEMKRGNALLNGIDFTKLIGNEDDKKKDKKTVLPYDLKDYDHRDKELANFIESLKYQMKPFEGKFDRESLEAVKNLVQQQVDKYRARVALAVSGDVGIPKLEQEAQDLLDKYNHEGDQELKNQYGRDYDEKIDKILKLKNSINDWTEEVRKLIEVTDEEKYKIDQATRARQMYDDEVELSKANMRGLTKDSQEYRAEIEKQNEILDKKRDLVVAEMSSLEKQIAGDKALLLVEGLLESQKNILIERIDKNSQSLRTLSKEYAGLTDEIYSNVAAIKESNKEWIDKTATVADKIVEGVKNAYEKQKDLVLKAIDVTLKAEEDAHKKKIDMLDDEQKKYDDIINSRIKALDKNFANEDFDKNLKKAQKERDDVKAKMDLLGMDTSLSGKAKLAELKKQLDEKDAAIADMKDKRERDLRKENLQEDLDAKKKEIDRNKKTEDEKFDQTKTKLEQIKKEQEKFYDDILQDEERWNKMRKNIMEGNTKDVIDEINKLSKGLQDIGKGDFTFLKNELGTYWTTFETITKNSLATLGVSLKTYLSQATSLKELIAGTVKPGETNPTGGLDQIDYGSRPTTPTNPEPTAKQRKADRDKYLSNKMMWFSEFATTGKMDSPNQTRFAKENNDFRNNPYYKNDPDFKDYAKDELAAVFPKFKDFLGDFREYIRFRMELTNPKTPVERRMQMMGQLLDLESKWIQKWGKEGVPVPRFSYDEMVQRGLDKFDTGGYTGSWGKDGKLAMLHQKELVLDENDTSNLLKAIQAVRAIIPQLTLPSSSKESGNSVIVQKVEMRIGSVSGGKQGAETLLEMFVDGLREKGAKL